MTEATLVECLTWDRHLRTLGVGDGRRHDVGLVGALPLDEKHQLAVGVRRRDDLLRLKSHRYGY